jgi:hypothetical protein
MTSTLLIRLYITPLTVSMQLDRSKNYTFTVYSFRKVFRGEDLKDGGGTRLRVVAVRGHDPDALLPAWRPEEGDEKVIALLHI